MRSIKFFTIFLLIVKICRVCSYEIFTNEDREIETQFVKSNYDWYCTSNDTCTTPGTSCTDEKCQCKPNYVFNAAMTLCLKAATNYGDYCQETSQCTAFMMVGGLCSKNICICSEGYHYLHGRCYKSAGFGDKCITDDDCYVNFDHGALSCTNNTCSCSHGYYKREYRSCRLEAKEPGAECTIDLDCTYEKNALCDENSECHVKNDNETQNRLFRRSTFRSAMYFRKGCAIDKECEVLGEGICNQATGMCVCKPGYFPDQTSLSCVPEIGEKCEMGEESTIENAICHFGRWGCKGATVPSKNNRICRRAVKVYNGYCDYDEQCYVFGPDARCIQSECRCNHNSHYYPKQKFCWTNKAIGQNCHADEDCYSTKYKIVCNNEHVCGCLNGTHVNAIGTGCVNDAPKVGDACSARSDCRGLNNTMCYNNFCECAPYYFESSGLCVNGIVAPCETDKDCKAVESICHWNACRCKDNYVPIDTGSCAPVVAFGGDCEYDVQCLANTTRSRCNSTGKCICLPYHHHRDGICYKTLSLGDNCGSQDEECWDKNHPNSTLCRDNYCRCNGGFKPSYNYIACYPISDDSSAASSSNHELTIAIGLTTIAMRLIGLL